MCVCVCVSVSVSVSVSVCLCVCGVDNCCVCFARQAELAHLHTFGRVLAGALLCGRRIGCHVAPALWKYISGERVNVHDLRPFDPTLARTLRYATCRCMARGQRLVGMASHCCWMQVAASGARCRKGAHGAHL